MDKNLETARDIIESLPGRFLKEQVEEAENGIFHFDISGTNGGEFTVRIENGRCSVSEGFVGEADCVVKAKDSVYEDVELGRTNPQMAFMMGRLKINNIGAMLKFINYFERLH